MACDCTPSLIGELEVVLKSGSTARRNEILHRVTDLFLNAADTCREEHIDVFDEVMERLIEKVERYALIRLSLQLAPVSNAPPKVVHHLADHDDIAISGPVIERSTLLREDFLIEIAKTKSQAHLSAIARRSQVSEKVVDVVVERGNLEVTRKIVANDGARFSDRSIHAVVERATGDEELALRFAEREDIPEHVIEELAGKATDIVRRRLISANPELRDRVNDALSGAASHVAKTDRTQSNRHKPAICLDTDPSKLRQRLCEKVKQGEHAEAMELLSRITEVPLAVIKNLVRQGAEDGVLILCKAAGLGWLDAKNMLALAVPRSRDDAQQKQAFEKYIGFTFEMAQRIMRFMKLRRTITTRELDTMM
jgi:uncharacterized protein (DUF2336 family)